MFVRFNATKLPNDFSKRIILRGRDIGNIRGDEMMNGKNVSHLDVKSGLRSRVMVIELVDIKLRFSISDVDYWFQVSRYSIKQVRESLHLRFAQMSSDRPMASVR